MKCPICGSDKAVSVTDSNGIYGPGGRSWVLYHICDGCSVLFADKEKFYNNQLHLTGKTDAGK